MCLKCDQVFPKHLFSHQRREPTSKAISEPPQVTLQNTRENRSTARLFNRDPICFVPHFRNMSPHAVINPHFQKRGAHPKLGRCFQFLITLPFVICDISRLLSRRCQCGIWGISFGRARLQWCRIMEYIITGEMFKQTANWCIYVMHKQSPQATIYQPHCANILE